MKTAILTIVFDGTCGLCARTVRFFFARESKAQFFFIPIQSEAGRDVAARTGIDPDDPETFAVISEDGTVRTKSSGAFHAFGYCTPVWRFAGAVANVLPRALTDRVYDFIARRRLLWFGTAETCALGPEALRQRLIEDRAALARLSPSVSSRAAF